MIEEILYITFFLSVANFIIIIGNTIGQWRWIKDLQGSLVHNTFTNQQSLRGLVVNENPSPSPQQTLPSPTPKKVYRRKPKPIKQPAPVEPKIPAPIQPTAKIVCPICLKPIDDHTIAQAKICGIM